MSCDVAKFTITKGLVNTFIFTIKADGSTLPMDVTNGTYVTTLLPLDPLDETPPVSLTTTKLEPYSNGKISVEVSVIQSNALNSDKGSKADRYYVKPMYKALIDCKDTDNGDFIAKVPEIYVD